MRRPGKASQLAKRRNRAGMYELNRSIVAVGIEPNGRVNFHPYELDPNTEDNPGPHNHKNLVKAFNHAHQIYLNKINPKFERGAMWMASLEQIDYSDADLEKIWDLR